MCPYPHCIFSWQTETLLEKHECYLVFLLVFQIEEHKIRMGSVLPPEAWEQRTPIAIKFNRCVFSHQPQEATWGQSHWKTNSIFTGCYRLRREELFEFPQTNWLLECSTLFHQRIQKTGNVPSSNQELLRAVRDFMEVSTVWNERHLMLREPERISRKEIVSKLGFQASNLNLGPHWTEEWFSCLH